MSTVRLDLKLIDRSLEAVEAHWRELDDNLDRFQIGRKDPFNRMMRLNMMSAYALLDELIANNCQPFTRPGIPAMLALNTRVHYGTNTSLMAEFASALQATSDKFYSNIWPIVGWYDKHAARDEHPFKLAAETYVSILGQPQLFIEGNHRTGALIASWINLTAGLPPFVLSVDNAISYFAPSAEIKRFADKSTWRGRTKLPKYRKVFREFWENHVEERYVLRAAEEPGSASGASRGRSKTAGGHTEPDEHQADQTVPRRP